MSATSDSLKNIIGVALAVCVVCSILVSTAAVALKPRQEANQRLEKIKNILIAGDLLEGKGKRKEIEAIFSEKIHPVLIELKTGDQLPKEKMTGKLSPENFDVTQLSKDSKFGRIIPSADDRANIKRMPLNMMVYYVKEGTDRYSKIIFPVYGSGLWSVMYGFLALDWDLKAIRGITFYEHGETPGLGGEIDNARWKASWKGKIAFDEAGNLKLKVLKGLAAPGAASEIDGLSGATLTTRGVDNMIAFWFGSQGYGPFLEKLRNKKEGSNE